MTEKSAESAHQRLQKLYARAETDDKRAAYAEWAEFYDNDIVHTLGYRAPGQATALLASVIEDRAQAVVLDFGCGTGLVGEHLTRAGFESLIGFDNSQAMLDQAQAKGCYQELHCADLAHSVEWSGGRADAGICVGVLGFGPVWVSHVATLFRLLKLSAPLIVTVNGRAWEEAGWGERLKTAEKRHQFRVEYSKTIDYLPAEGIEGRLLLLRSNDEYSRASSRARGSRYF